MVVEKSTKIRIEEFFDPHNIEHLRAFRSLYRGDGKWPDGFLPENIDFGSCWQHEILIRMALCWVDEKLGQ
jgi:hypothetical protein